MNVDSMLSEQKFPTAYEGNDVWNQRSSLKNLRFSVSVFIKSKYSSKNLEENFWHPSPFIIHTRLFHRNKERN